MKQCGMSLIEIMVGVVLLALILVPSLNVITTKTQSVNSTRDHAQAAFIAQNIIEQCRSYKFELMDMDHFENSDSDANKEKTFEYKLKNGEFDQTLNNISYKVDSEKSKVAPLKKQTNSNDNNSLPAIWLVKLVLNYVGQDGRSHSFEVTTAISQRE